MRPASLAALRPLTVLGIMSGTSADGIDIAIVRIAPRRVRQTNGLDLTLDLLHHSAYPFAPALRQAVLRAAGAERTTTPELARLHWRLGLAYAEAAREAVLSSRAAIDLAGCHGQTVYHQGTPSRTLGRRFTCTWQIGEPAPLAHALRVPVVSNFRPADMVAGGQGAPLVPLLDFVLYRDAKRARVLQNIGGIGNLTVVPAGAQLEQVRALDTGPGNMVIDTLMRELFGQPYDRNGATAARGEVLEPVVSTLLRSTGFFRKQPPRSAGREQFGAAFAEALLRRCMMSTGRKEDAVATATALTAQSIALAYRQFVLPAVANSPVDFLASGGGARNGTLMRMLAELLRPLGARVGTTAAAAKTLPVEAKEAAAFALLAYQTWHGRPANVPSATGAGTQAILGHISYA